MGKCFYGNGKKQLEREKHGRALRGYCDMRGPGELDESLIMIIFGSPQTLFVFA